MLAAALQEKITTGKVRGVFTLTSCSAANFSSALDQLSSKAGADVDKRLQALYVALEQNTLTHSVLLGLSNIARGMLVLLLCANTSPLTCSALALQNGDGEAAQNALTVMIAACASEVCSSCLCSLPSSCSLLPRRLGRGPWV